jgi:hypothetical protein
MMQKETEADHLRSARSKAIEPGGEAIFELRRVLEGVICSTGNSGGLDRQCTYVRLVPLCW